MNEVHENGYLIHWYNLSEDNDAEYLEWLHGEYIPRRLNGPRILWACHFKSLDNVTHPGEKCRVSHDNKSIPKLFRALNSSSNIKLNLSISFIVMFTGILES